jgi:hypothetical protein
MCLVSSSISPSANAAPPPGDKKRDLCWSVPSRLSLRPEPDEHSNCTQAAMCDMVSAGPGIFEGGTRNVRYSIPHISTYY